MPEFDIQDWNNNELSLAFQVPSCIYDSDIRFCE